MAAIAAHQRPLPRLVAALHVAFDQHRLASRHWFAKAAAQLCRASDQFPGQVQVLQGHMADHFGTGIAKHLLGTGVEGADDAAQVGGDDRDLGGGIQHATQLAMGAAQLLLSIAQLPGALLDQFQRPLPLADQHIQQGTEHHAEQSTQHHHTGHRGMVGLHERVAGLDIDLIVMVGHAQQARGRQLADGRRVG
ncbi:hypothetical protein D3C86_1314580 [compost metagenome]